MKKGLIVGLLFVCGSVFSYDKDLFARDDNGRLLCKYDVTAIKWPIPIFPSDDILKSLWPNFRLTPMAVNPKALVDACFSAIREQGYPEEYLCFYTIGFWKNDHSTSGVMVFMLFDKDGKASIRAFDSIVQY